MSGDLALPLYAQIMGDRFAQLPPAVRAVHSAPHARQVSGTATVGSGATPIARLIARLAGFPPPGEDVPLRVEFSPANGGETWRRDFAGDRFVSWIGREGELLVERIGPLSFAFELESQPAGLAMRLRGWRLGPIALPLGFAPHVEAREWEDGGRFHFDVSISPRWIGRMIHYHGWLEVGC